MEVENSWKGKIWFLYLLWPFAFIGLAYNFDIENATTMEWLLSIVVLAITGLWFYGTHILIRNFKDTFKPKK